MHTLTFTDSASRPGSLSHAGPLSEARIYFHGEIGPQWPCAFDGRQGHFTATADEQHADGEVRFVDEDASRPGGLPVDVDLHMGSLPH